MRLSIELVHTWRVDVHVSTCINVFDKDCFSLKLEHVEGFAVQSRESAE